MIWFGDSWVHLYQNSLSIPQDKELLQSPHGLSQDMVFINMKMFMNIACHVSPELSFQFWFLILTIENSIETCVLSSVKHIASPGQMHETSAQGWCTGKTQRDGMGREVGVGIRMGNTCKTMADSCQCMAKTTTVS